MGGSAGTANGGETVDRLQPRGAARQTPDGRRAVGAAAQRNGDHHPIQRRYFLMMTLSLSFNTRQGLHDPTQYTFHFHFFITSPRRSSFFFKPPILF